MIVLSYNGAGERFFAGWLVGLFSGSRVKFSSAVGDAIIFADRYSAQRFLATCPALDQPLGITELE